MRVELEPAFILHTKSYRETSMLVYALTEQHGVVHLVSRAAKKKGNNQIQPFTKMYLSWSGRSDLMSLTKVELDYSNYTKDFRAHVQSFYMHELILKLVPIMSPSSELYHLYESTLDAMIQNPKREDVLRIFEIKLLDIIGHALQLSHDYKTDLPIEIGLNYVYEPDHGPCLISNRINQWNSVTGALLLALDRLQFEKNNLLEAKIFLRGLMQYYLNGRPLMSRQLLKVR